ncbi:MAG: winged helix-turn-helix domain-containing protein [Solobacterium sp.]|nr:winged helix-turn-helix domain-containing protein [Solobacterium sp.]MBQ9823255.1 winged helix-turn-helix domain-containing protein [Solobacterium sp.]
MSVKLNRDDHTVDTQRGSAYLTPKEFGILAYLMEHQNECTSPEDIYSNVWQAEPFACRPVIAVHIRHLREKIETDPSNPRYLKASWGKGYRFTM